MNKRGNSLLFTFLLSIFALPALAQWNASQDDTTSAMSVSGAAELYNNSLRNDWVFWLLGGSKPSVEAQNSQQTELATRNTLVASNRVGFRYQQMDTAGNAGWWVSGSFNDLRSTSLTKDAADLILNGNGHMEDYNAKLTNSTFLSQQWQSVKAGRVKRTPNGWMTYHGGIITGTRLDQANISRGTVFTEKNGEYLDLDYSGYRRNASFGLGLSVGFTYQHVVDENQRWRFSINDVGMIYWWSDAQTQEKDTQFRYNGVAVDDVNNWNAGSVEERLDSLGEELLGRTVSGGFGSNLPARMQFQYTYSFDQFHQLSLGAGFQVAGNSLYHMQWFTHHWSVTPKFSLHSGIDVVQLRGLNWREEVRFDLPTGWAGIGLTGLDAPLVPSEYGGLGVAFSAGIYLK